MLQAEATKLFEAERILQRLQERKLPLPVLADLCRAQKLISEAISYQDDEPHHVMTDDD